LWISIPRRRYLEEYVLRDGTIRFLKMGRIKQGGSSCYCKESAFLKCCFEQRAPGSPRSGCHGHERRHRASHPRHRPRGGTHAGSGGADQGRGQHRPGRGSAGLRPGAARVLFVGNKIRIINAPADKVYQIVKDMGRYPEFIPSLKEVTVLENGPGYTVTKWGVKSAVIYAAMD